MEEIGKIILRQSVGTTASSAVKLAFDKLFSCLQNRLGSLLGDGDDLTNIKSSLDTIQSVIVSTEVRPLKDQDLLDWLEKLKDAAYEAEDVLDEYATEDLRRKVEAQNSNSDRDPVTNNVRKITSSISINPVLDRRKMTFKLKEIRKRLQSIEEESLKFKLSKRVENWESDFKKHRQTHSSVDESEVYGREEDKEQIIQLLLLPVAGHEDENVSVIPIVGIGGLGKTTLAQLVFNDHRVHNHFELKMWVYVSDDFDVRKLMEKIVRLATDTDSKLSDLDLEELQHRVGRALNEKKFLLVLDDVWNEEHDKWSRLRLSLICGGGRGSRIVVTTRNLKIAVIMSRIEPHHLEGLSEGDCRKLFASRAFLDDREGDHPKLVEIGKDIVSKCRGVPLALITLGSLLSFKRNESEWVLVRDSELWNLAAEDVSAILPTEYVRAILASLMLSYYHLSQQLRPCFTFCAIFPKDYNIDKELLIQLWMAHGCVPSIGGMQLEDIGISILNELLKRSLFQEVKKDGRDSSKVKVHDLVHDLAQSVMRNDCSIIQPGKSVNISEKVRHLSCFQTSETLPNFLCEAHESLRTFFVLYHDYFEAPQFMPGLKFLRVLHLELANDDEQPLPTSLGELIHLRYLRFSTNAIRTLPESIGNLLNLQTLKLNGCYNLRELPKSTRNLINLRCLDIDSYGSLSHMPAKIGMLSCLRKLPFFAVGDSAGVYSGIEELQYLNQLKGNLMIKHLERAAIPSNAQQAILTRKENLDSLQLCWRGSFPGGGDIKIEAEEEVLKALKPHKHLKELEIFFYGGIHFPDWMTGLSLPRIEKITLRHCKKCEILPPLGQLPSLKFLYICGMARVEKICSEFFGNDTSEGFPKLKELKIENMDSLKVWSGLHGERVFPSLQILSIIHCKNLKSLPEGIGKLPSLENLSLWICGLTSLPEGIGNLSSLKVLILNNLRLTSLPESIQKLSTLRKLTIWRCHHLPSLPEGIGNLPSLQQLKLYDVGLTCLPDGIGNLSSLKKLELHDVGLTYLPDGIGNLSSLKQLRLHNVGLTSLPESMKELSILQELSIKSCPQLPSLPEWMRNLIALQLLTIHDCPHMLSLPLGFHHLTGLRRLSITKCPELRRRCEQTGQDFHKIQHIPEVNFWWWDSFP